MLALTVSTHGTTLSAAMLPRATRRPAPAARLRRPVPPPPVLMTRGAEFDGTAAVGALFTIRASGRLKRHFCSASVVASPSGNLVMTAAHCLSGLVPGRFAFVPGYHSGQEPYGAWTVERVITDSRWETASDPADDFAFLEVRKPGSTARLQDVTGAERMGVKLPPHQLVTAVAYPNRRDRPISCLNYTIPFNAGQLRFACRGYTVGTSGGPLLADVSPASGLGMIVGVIGGYQRGGHTGAVSYAAQLGSEAEALYQQAIASR